jgi:hypothetical protein
MTKTVSCAADPRLYDHLQAMAVLYSTMEGRKVSVSQLLRNALIKTYGFGQVECKLNSPVVANVLQNECKTTNFGCRNCDD